MKGRQIPYTDDELAFIQSVSKWDRSEARAAYCQRFNRDDVSLQNFNALCKRKGWFTGRTGRIEPGNVPFNKGKPHPTRGRAAQTQFKAGGLPHNTRHLGYERISKDGYVEISVAETNPHTGYERRFVHKHRYLWEQANGPIPEGCALKCLDGDKANTDPSNWEAIPRGVLARLNGGRFRKTVPYDQASDELKPIVMASAKLKHAARERRKAASPPPPRPRFCKEIRAMTEVRSGLYPHHKPIGIKAAWDHTSMELFGSGEVLRRHGVPADYGTPVDAVAWFDSNGDGALKVLVADYPDGRRVTLRKRPNGSSLEIVTPERPTPATQERTDA